MRHPVNGVRFEDEHGLALISTLLVVGLIGVITAAAVAGSIATLRVSVADYREARAFYAAEAGAEGALAAVQAALQDGHITHEELAEITPPELEGFDFSGFRVERSGDGGVETITDGPFAGLYALTQDFDVISPATDPAGGHSSVILGVKAQAIPIFQFGVFYEDDLEIHNGPPMDFYGRVHSNGDIYLNSKNVYFHELITTPERVIWNYKVDDYRRNGVYIHDNDGNPVQLTFDSRDIPDPDQFVAKSNAFFDGRLQTGAFGVEPLNLPLPAGVEPHELVRPKDGSDTEVEKKTKLAWLADMHVTIDLDNLSPKASVCGGAGGPALHPRIHVVHLGGSTPGKATKCTILDWEFEQFYDSRELKPVDVLNIDIGALTNWINADPAANATQLVYVKFVLPTDPIPDHPLSDPDPSGDGFYPSVRVRDGATLPGPLSIATEYPLYIWGDYNAIDKKPAALAGDVFHVLSNSWDDAEHQSAVVGEWNLTGASATTVYASIITGHSASDCDVNEDPGCSGSLEELYGGGFENMPRFLEHWKHIDFEYRGSMVSLWEAKHALGDYQAPNGPQQYYEAPDRNWGFDDDLLDPANLPPGTPVVGSVVRTAFRTGF